jgi:hypothetical protein
MRHRKKWGLRVMTQSISRCQENEVKKIEDAIKVFKRLSILAMSKSHMR